MNTISNNAIRIKPDDDVFAYRSQAARLRSEAVCNAFKSMISQTRALFSQPADKSCQATD